MKDDLLYVSHVLDCIRKIENYCERGEPSFRSSDLIQDGVLRNLQTLAESTQRISDAVKTLHPEVDWRSIAGFRNVLAHEYLGINLDHVWQVVSEQLPVLSSQMAAIRRELETRG